MTGGTITADVAVLGGGLAGLATAIHLARRDRRVLCVEPHSWPRQAVGESLEFSAPQLLFELGVSPNALIGSGHGFPKTAVEVVTTDDRFYLWPPPAFARPPIWCSMHTLHVDRAELDTQIMQIALSEGVTILQARVCDIVHHDSAVSRVVTDGGDQIRAEWFVDGSGHGSQILGRALGLQRVELGPSRVSYWTRLPASQVAHATRLYFCDPDRTDLSWAWEIPLNSEEVSVGVVLSASRLRDLRVRGLTPRQVFEEQVEQMPRLRGLLSQHPRFDLQSTSFRPYRYRSPTGPNWVLVGEASALVDPLTSNGVTSALRHASTAASLIDSALTVGHVTRRHEWLYRNTVSTMASTLDVAIEALVYGPAVRRRLGLRAAVNCYGATGIISNSIYSKINPTTVPQALGCALVLAASRAWSRVASRTVAAF